MIYDIIIMGSGASGMMAALNALKKNKSVLLIDKMKAAGKKLRATGNGKCNLSNINMSSAYYRGHNIDIVDKAFAIFNEHDAVDFFETIGIPSYEKNGYIYPMCGSAGQFTDILVEKITELGGEWALDMFVKEVIPGDLFTVKTTFKNFKSTNVILSTGGMSYRSLGGDESSFSIAKSLGHHVYPVYPALTGLKSCFSMLQTWNGIRCKGKVSLFVNGAYIASDDGELQLTDYGISGIPVFQISRYAAYGLADNKDVNAEIDFAEDYSEEELYNYLNLIGGSIRSRLQGLFNIKLINVFANNINSSAESDISVNGLRKLCSAIKHFNIIITGTRDFNNSQVTAGGIDTSEINPETMESKLVKGLYITGEAMDIDGICGGYNLQWAWTTGFIAGINAGE